VSDEEKDVSQNCNSTMGDVYALNPKTKAFGPVCDEDWDIKDVSRDY